MIFRFRHSFIKKKYVRVNINSAKNEIIGNSKVMGSTANGVNHIIDKNGATRLLNSFGLSKFLK